MTVAELFASRLMSPREDSGFSQAQVADSLSVSRGSISFYKNGERTPGIALLAVVKDHFGVSLDYLLGYSESKYSDKPVIDINSFAKLPPYVKNRIEAVKDQKPQVASTYIPAKGKDPPPFVWLYLCRYADRVGGIRAFEREYKRGLE